MSLLAVIPARSGLQNRVRYGRAALPHVSGEITIEPRSANAATVVEHMRARIDGR
jgi:hypothetical protein